MTHAPPKRQKPAHPVCAESERPPIGGHSKRTPAPGLQCTAADAPVASGHREQTPAPDSPCRNCPLPEGGRVLLPEPRGAARSKEILSPGSEEILRWSGWKVTPRRSPPEAREGPNLAGGKGDEADLPLLGGPRTQLQTSGHPTLFRRALGGNPVPMFPQRRPGGFPGPLSAQQRAGPLSALQRAGKPGPGTGDLRAHSQQLLAQRRPRQRALGWRQPAERDRASSLATENRAWGHLQGKATESHSLAATPLLAGPSRVWEPRPPPPSRQVLANLQTQPSA